MKSEHAQFNRMCEVPNPRDTGDTWELCSKPSQSERRPVPSSWTNIDLDDEYNLT